MSKTWAMRDFITMVEPTASPYGLDAALTRYKAAQAQKTPSAKITAAFLKLVDS